MQKIEWHVLKKSVLKENSPEEEEDVRVWREESEENRKYYNRLEAFLHRPGKEKVDVERNYHAFIREMNKHSYNRILRWSLGVAAAACIAGFAIVLLWVNKPVSQMKGRSEVIVAGTHKAILYPGNGSPIVLGEDTCRKILSAGNFQLSQVDNQIDYIMADSVYLRPEIHTLKVPHGGEFQLCLSDGTQVFVNSESELKYPAVFTGNERKVRLIGEAYFRVTKSFQPFIIEVNGMVVQVLGTEFNIRAYPDEQACQTTLASGKVEVRTENEKIFLQSGEQAVFTHEKKLSKHAVDVNKYTAWKDGCVAFEDERLEDIMTKLARWYNIKVFYSSSALKDIRFTGNINRYGDIRILLQKIEKLDVVSFGIKENCITVSAK